MKDLEKTNEFVVASFLDYINYIIENKNIKRGNIVYANINASDDTHIQKGYRPYIIVSNNQCNKYSPVVTAVPLTTKLKHNLPTHVEISGCGLKLKSTALCEQIISIDKNEIIKIVGNLDGETLDKVTSAIKLQIGA